MRARGSLGFVAIALGALGYAYAGVACSGGDDASGAAGDDAGAGGGDGSANGDGSGSGDARGGGDDGGGGACDGGASCDAAASCGPCAQPDTCGGGDAANACGHPACTSGTWSSAVTVATTQEGPLSIAVDAAGGVHVAYIDAAARDVFYAHRPPGEAAWNTEVVRGAGDAGAAGDVAIAVDAAGHAHVALQAGDHVHYATRTSPGNWSVEDAFSPLNLGGAHVMSLDVDPSGAPHIATMFDGPLGDASLVVQAGHLSRAAAGGAWTMESLGAAAYVQEPSARVVGSDVHVTFTTAAGVVTDAHRPLAGGAWTADPIASDPSPTVFVSPVAVLPPTNELHVAYAGDGGLRDARRSATPAAWTTELASPSGTCIGTACETARSGGLGADGWGQLHAVFDHYTFFGIGNGDTDEVRYAMRPNDGGAWTTTTISPTNTLGRSGIFNAMAVDAHNGLHVVYTYVASSSSSAPASVLYAYRCP